MPSTANDAQAGSTGTRLAWLMLIALSTGFTLSQAFRTVAAIMGPPLAQELGLSKQQLGLWAATFHFSFGLMQLIFGVSIDLWGVRRTILAAFPMAVLGAVVSALAPSFGVLLLGQAMIGTGCSPAFLVCTVFIARHFSADRFTATSGVVMSVSGLGVLLTATPLAALIEATSWRWSYGALALLGVAAWVAIFLRVRDAASEPAPEASAQQRQSVWQAMGGLVQLFRLPHTAGLVAYALVAYAGFITLRGLWLGPILIERHGLSLVQSGNVALLMTLGSMVSPAVFGRLDPGGERRVRWLIGFSLTAGLLLLAMAFARSLWLDVALPIVYGALSGYGLLQYGYVYGAYPAAARGRALSLFTMAMFLGVSLMQWVSGVAATAAKSLGFEPFAGALATMALMLAAGGVGFWLLPRAGTGTPP
ncbi:MFS transporter [Ottowia sp.]|uniref:MFS transporter n=1 Tax=Ottowia sp. TaxID=1898956 RepID=UPI00262F57AF|nr:MFS transporter [Ottowia sp.]